MAQCKAETASGTQCVSQVVAPSRSLCLRHQNVLASGKPLINFESGRKFPALAVAVKNAPAKAAAARPVTRAAAPRATVAPRAAVAVVEEERPVRGPGEHPLICDAPRCGLMTMPGTDYCMKHQGMAG